MKEVFFIPYPKSPSGRKAWNKAYGFNKIYAGCHWSIRKQDAQYWHMLTTSAMNAARCRRKPFEKPVMIRFFWNDRLDLSNHAYMAKLIEDAMKGRIITDDSRRWVQGIAHRFHEEDNIKVVVEEVKE